MNSAPTMWVPAEGVDAAHGRNMGSISIVKSGRSGSKEAPAQLMLGNRKPVKIYFL